MQTQCCLRKICNPTSLEVSEDHLLSTKFDTPWTLDVHTHAAVLEEAVRKAAALGFSLSTKTAQVQCRRPFLATDRFLDGLSGKIVPSWLRACFASWRGLHCTAWTARREVSDTFIHTCWRPLGSCSE